MEKENSFKAVVGQVKPDVKQSMSSPSVAVGDLPIFVSVGTVSEREEIRRSRTEAFRDDRPLFDNGNKAFTLIELLVVVLIIGILAAVALPQYQKAVEKSRATQMFVVLKNIVQAQEAYKMANGSYATQFDDLAVEFPWSGTETWAPGNIVDDTRSNGTWSLQIWNGGGTSKIENSAVYLGRLNGKYKGGGFVYFLQNTYGFPSQQILCQERKSGVQYEQTIGSYCQEIFRGTFIAEDSGTRLYKLP